jgi:hypothetical protein
LEAIREFLERDVLAATQGQVQFHVRVAVKALGVVERELLEGPRQAARHGAGLTTLGLDSEADLAAAIRTGTLDDRLAEVSAFVRATVVDKLLVANPGYLDGT